MSDWLVVPQPNPHADVQLICLPNAGGGIATFSGWWQRMPASIELALAQLPGRDARRREPCFATIADAAGGMAGAIQREPVRRRVFFGHSLGALLAFEVSRRLHGTPHAPFLLVASGRKAPSLPETRPAISHLPMDAFMVEAQQRYGGIPEVVLDDPDLCALFLPILRADLASVEVYRYESSRPLECPIVAYGGTHDEHATAEDLAPWRRETAASFRLRQFIGGHFFVQSARDLVIASLVSDITAAQL